MANPNKDLRKIFVQSVQVQFEQIDSNMLKECELEKMTKGNLGPRKSHHLLASPLYRR